MNTETKLGLARSFATYSSWVIMAVAAGGMIFLLFMDHDSKMAYPGCCDGENCPRFCGGGPWYFGLALFFSICILSSIAYFGMNEVAIEVHAFVFFMATVWCFACATDSGVDKPGMEKYKTVFILEGCIFILCFLTTTKLHELKGLNL